MPSSSRDNQEDSSQDPTREFKFTGSDLKGDEKNLSALKLLSEMFSYSRIDRSASLFARFILVMYFPIGLVVTLLRLVLMFLMGFIASWQCSFCFPRHVHTVLLRVEMLLFFGVWVEVNGDPDSRSPLWVANHVSEFDAIALRTISDPYILGYSMYTKMFWLRFTPLQLLKMIYVPQTSRSEGNTSGRDKINDVIKATIEKNDGPVLLFPEGGLTNGRKALMQYHKFVFGLGHSVQPIALSVSSPFPLLIDTLNATFIGNVLVFFFIPFQKYTIDFLSPLSINIESAETPLDFSRRTMETTARKLNLLPSPFLYNDKKKWAKVYNALKAKGHEFGIAVDHSANEVFVYDANSSIFACCTAKPVLPLDSMQPGDKFSIGSVAPMPEEAAFKLIRNKEILLNEMHEVWQMNSKHFSHTAFVGAVEERPS